MLVVALVPTTGVSWTLFVNGVRTIYSGDVISSLSVAPAVLARCFWQSPMSGSFESVALCSSLILVLSYVWKAMLLFKTSHIFFKITYRQYLQTAVTGRLDRILSRLQCHQRPRVWLLTRYKLALGLYLMI